MFLAYEIDINQFKKGKRINKGGYGVVYEVTEKKTGKLYAAKIIDCNDEEDQCKKMIDREIGIMITANHPTIVKLIGYSFKDFHDENNITIILQFAKNGSLATILKKIQDSDGPVDYTNTTRQIILIGVARGMKYLHDRNIIHRDLKPGNILLDENFHPLITDFGLSKKFEEGHSKSQTQFGGTLAYIAPEIIESDKYDRKADVYSFGILMFELVTDLPAYPNLVNGTMNDFKFREQIVYKNMRPEFKFPVKQEIRNLIEQCWSKDPNDRPTFNEIFNKLANNDIDKTKDYFLDDIDLDEVELYIEDVSESTDPIEELLKIKEKLGRENLRLINENSTIKSENNKLSISLKKLEKIDEENRKLKNENSRLKEENQRLVTENTRLRQQQLLNSTEISNKSKNYVQKPLHNDPFKSTGQQQYGLVNQFQNNPFAKITNQYGINNPFSNQYQNQQQAAPTNQFNTAANQNRNNTTQQNNNNNNNNDWWSNF